MPAGRINMKNCRNFILIQCQIVVNAIGRRNGIIIITIYDEGTRCLFCHLFSLEYFSPARQKLLFLTGYCERTHVGIRLIHRNHRIKQDLKLGRSSGLAWVANRRRQMTTGRRSHNTNIIWIQIPYISTVTHNLHCCFGIRNRKRAIAFRHSIFQHNKSNALLVKVRSPIVTFVVNCQMGISFIVSVYFD